MGDTRNEGEGGRDVVVKLDRDRPVGQERMYPFDDWEGESHALQDPDQPSMIDKVEETLDVNSQEQGEETILVKSGGRDVVCKSEGRIQT